MSQDKKDKKSSDAFSELGKGMSDQLKKDRVKAADEKEKDDYAGQMRQLTAMFAKFRDDLEDLMETMVNALSDAFKRKFSTKTEFAASKADQAGMEADYAAKYGHESWYQAPENRNGNSHMAFPDKEALADYLKDQSDKGRSFVMVDPETQKVAAYSNGDGNLYHANGTQYKSGDTFTPSDIDRQDFQMPPRQNPSPTNNQSATANNSQGNTADNNQSATANNNQGNTANNNQSATANNNQGNTADNNQSAAANNSSSNTADSPSATAGNTPSNTPAATAQNTSGGNATTTMTRMPNSRPGSSDEGLAELPDSTDTNNNSNTAAQDSPSPHIVGRPRIS